MSRFHEASELEEVGIAESQEFVANAERAFESMSIEGPTDEAEMFNHHGTSDKWHIRVELWGETDQPSKPAPYSAYVKSFVRAGVVERTSIRPNIMGVYCRWTYFDTKTSKTYKTKAVKPPPIFGPRTYFKEVSVFWYATSTTKPDSAEQGGLIGILQ